MADPTKPFPQRPASHVIGDDAVHLFVQACPKEWVVAPVVPDYGLDLRIELVHGGQVTGEEFAVQVKGKMSIKPDAEGTVTIGIRNSTINYWLGKLHPTMIVAVDTSTQRLWYGWLDVCYMDYPRHLASGTETELRLLTEVLPDFSAAVTTHILRYFSILRSEINIVGDRVGLARFSLHLAALARTLTQIHLALTSGQSAESLQEILHLLFLEYGIHDSFLCSLLELDSPWRQPLSSRISGIVLPKLETYLRLRDHFWMRKKIVRAGDFDLIPFSYSALRNYLLPTLESAWDLQESLQELLVLGSVVGGDSEKGGRNA